MIPPPCGPARLQRLLLAGLSVVAFSIASPAGAECPGDFLVSPSRLGEAGQSLLESFHTLVNDLYQSAAVRTVEIDGELHLAPPWFDSSTECTEWDLKDGEGAIAFPSFADYALNGDELSELAVVLALSDDDERMMQLHHTVEAMESQTYQGMPCWLARVQTGPPASISCISEDTASDITARIGLAYYHAAANPHFSSLVRDLMRVEADALARLHLTVEYANDRPFNSGVTSALIDDWIGGGGNTAASLEGLTMWIGYHQDIVLFLLAAYASTNDPIFLHRAQDVVDQWLMATEFQSGTLLFGRFNFGWDTSSNPLVPMPGDSFWWEGNRAWDDADAPRALWMGHVLRARELLTQGTPLDGAWQILAEWIELLLATDTQTPTTSCVEYNRDGTIPLDAEGQRKNCGTDYFYNGLGAGLLTFFNRDWLAPKLDTILPQYAWSGAKTWNNASCFGIYRGVRPVKALASALGLDAATFGGTRPGACVRLDVARSGIGAGFVTTSSGAIDCGGDCLDLYPTGEVVALEAHPYSGSSFAGWSGDGCEGGTPTLDVPRTCTASFDGTCDPVLELSQHTVVTSELFAGCGEVRAGNGFVVAANGVATLRAGERIALHDGFRVEMGGRLVARVVEP